MFLKPFKVTGDTVTIAASATNAQAGIFGNASQVLIQNAGPNTAFIRFGKTAGQTAAVATDLPILSGQSRVITKDAMDQVAAICNATQTATLYLTPGEGM